MLEVFVSVDAAEDLWTLQTQFKPCRYMTDRQADKHFYLTSEKIRYQGEENDRKVFESSSPAKVILPLRPKVYKIHIGLHISAKTVQTYPQDICTHKQDLKTKRRGKAQLQQTSGKI